MGDPRASLLDRWEDKKIVSGWKRRSHHQGLFRSEEVKILSQFGLRESKNVTKDLFVRRPLNVNPRHVYVGQRSTLLPYISYSSGRPKSIANGFQWQGADGLSSP